MKIGKLYMIWLWGLLLLMAACGDDDYYYPSVKMEFVTIEAGDDGRIRTLIPDKGDILPVSQDLTGSTISPNTARRVMSNYETMEEGAKIYSLQSLLTPTPKPKDDPAFKDKEGKDPVEVVSIWLGRDYLNMILNLKASTGKGHIFGIIEDKSELETIGSVDMLLYHDADSDEEYYNRRAYISVPLKQYAESEHPADGIKIKFRYYTYGKEADVIEDYEFEYTPGKTE